MTALEILVAAREWLTPPERWTKGAFWRDAEGEECTRRSARSGCAFSAIDNAGGSYSERVEASELFRLATKAHVIADWNDAPERTHAEVLAAFDRAIALAKEGR